MHHSRAWYLVVTLIRPPALAAQDIPAYVPANPVLASRSALYAQPFIGPQSGWRMRFVTDYYSAVEVAHSSDARQTLFDAEVLQADVWLTRDVSRRVFVLANLPLRGAYSGFLDRFLIWYHNAIGLSVPARNERPRDVFTWHVALPDTTIDRARPGTFLGDLRMGAGVRLGRTEVIATMTVPTATLAAEGWARGTVGTSLAVTTRALESGRLRIEAGVGAGFTPVHGVLARYQRSTFASVTLASRWRFAGLQSAYATVWGQSANWKDTGLSALDDREWTADFGVLLRVARDWPEIQLGMTQDLVPHGPAMDVGFSVGVRW